MKKILFLCAIALSVGFASCSDTDTGDISNSDTDTEDINSIDGVSIFTQGGFLLNEGNFGTNGHLAYINRRTGVYTDSVYYKVNHKMLGNTAQAMTFANGRVYIVSQLGSNNDSEGLLVIADAQTLKRIESGSPDELKGKNPDQVALLGQDIYVHSTTYTADYAPVYALYRIQPGGSVSTIEGGEDVTNLPMVKCYDKLYAASKNKEILVIQAGRVIKKIPMAGTPTGIQVDEKGMLWVSTEGNFQGITKINMRNMEQPVLEQHQLAQPIGRGYAHVAAFAVHNNKIYFCNNTSTIYKYDFSSKTTLKMVDVVTLNANGAINYNGVSIDPVTGDIYYSGLKSFGEWKQNVTFVFSDNGTGLVKKWEYRNKNAMPAGMFFPESF